MTAPASGDHVRVRAWWPPGHVRTPAYIRGCRGVVVRVQGPFEDPERLAYAQVGPRRLLCTVRFEQAEVWPGYAGEPHDSLQVDIYEHWLEKD